MICANTSTELDDLLERDYQSNSTASTLRFFAHIEMPTPVAPMRVLAADQNVVWENLHSGYFKHMLDLVEQCKDPGFGDDFYDHLKKRSIASKDLLPSFLRLQNADTYAVVRFVEQWGILGIDAVMFPALDVAGRYVHVNDDGNRIFDDRFEEPAASYVFFARWLQSFLNIAGTLQNGELGTADDWDLIASLNTVYPSYVVEGNREFPVEPRSILDNIRDRVIDRDNDKQIFREVRLISKSSQSTVESGRSLLSQIINACLVTSTYLDASTTELVSRHNIEFSESMIGRFRMGQSDVHATDFLTSFSILRPLLVQLLLALTRPMYKCWQCGKRFAPERKPRGSGQEAALCSDECQRARHNEIQRLTARKRRELTKQGMSPGPRGRPPKSDKRS